MSRMSTGMGQFPTGAYEATQQPNLWPMTSFETAAVASRSEDNSLTCQVLMLTVSMPLLKICSGNVSRGTSMASMLSTTYLDHSNCLEAVRVSHFAAEWRADWADTFSRSSRLTSGPQVDRNWWQKRWEMLRGLREMMCHGRSLIAIELRQTV